jgi:hypothetical protein
MKGSASRENCDSRAWWISTQIPTVFDWTEYLESDGEYFDVESEAKYRNQQ